MPTPVAGHAPQQMPTDLPNPDLPGPAPDLPPPGVPGPDPDTFPDPMPDPAPIPAHDPLTPPPGEITPPVHGQAGTGRAAR